MNIFKDIELLECPCCQGAGLLEEEQGWCVYVTCLDCGAHTAEFPYRTEEEKPEAAKQAARTWNMGKAISSHPGE